MLQNLTYFSNVRSRGMTLSFSIFDSVDSEMPVFNDSSFIVRFCFFLNFVKYLPFVFIFVFIFNLRKYFKILKNKKVAKGKKCTLFLNQE